MPYLGKNHFRYTTGTGNPPVAYVNEYSNDCVELRTSNSTSNPPDYSASTYLTYFVHDFMDRHKGFWLPFAGSSPSDMTGLAEHFSQPVNVVDSNDKSPDATYCIIQAMHADVSSTTADTALGYMKLDPLTKSPSQMSWNA